MRQSQQQAVGSGATATDGKPVSIDTNISGLTFVCASTPREVENLVTREFHADPNLHKNANVDLVGDYSTNGSPSVSFEWTWKWKPPKALEDRSGGWRHSCSVGASCHCLLTGNADLVYSLSSTIRADIVLSRWPASRTGCRVRSLPP